MERPSNLARRPISSRLIMPFSTILLVSLIWALPASGPEPADTGQILGTITDGLTPLVDISVSILDANGDWVALCANVGETPA